MEVRLNRALEEVSKLKAGLAKTTGARRETDDGLRHQVSKLEGAVRGLERQKAELLSAFRKQMKLIDVLRRQKLHVEAARLLEFTEEEFVKVLDWA
ncbi:unnamed protein product [Chrysoparadoxa australica]